MLTYSSLPHLPHYRLFFFVVPKATSFHIRFESGEVSRIISTDEVLKKDLAHIKVITRQAIKKHLNSIYTYYRFLISITDLPQILSP